MDERCKRGKTTPKRDGYRDMNKLTEIIMRDIGNPELTEAEEREIGKLAVDTVLGLEDDDD